jgi:superoxide dismutase, Cu-Zn family
MGWGVKGKEMKPLVPMIALLVLAGCATGQQGGKVPEKTAMAKLQRGDGSPAGSARLINRDDGVFLELDANAPGAGSFGMHIHATGKCEGPDFISAGPHWNPASRQHGRDNPMGSHAGDLPNVSANSAGKLILTQKLEGYPFDGPAGVLDADGAALIIHEKADDYKTDPTGNSGKRVICGVFEKI